MGAAHAESAVSGCRAALLTTVNEAVESGGDACRAARRARGAGARRRPAAARRADPASVSERGVRGADEDRGRDAVADGFTHAAFGDLFLEDVRRYREERLAGTGLTPLFPVWGIPTDRTGASEMIAQRSARAAGVRRHARPRRRPSSAASSIARCWRTCRAGVDPCGENGEFHTCVYDGPMFKDPLVLEPGEIVTREPFAWRDLHRR